MTHWWLAPRRRETKRARALRTPLRVEHLEARNLLTHSLVVVPSPQIAGDLGGAAAIASNDIWAVGENLPATPMSTVSTLAEHFNGTSWTVITTPSPAAGGFFSSVARVTSNDVWAVGSDLTGTHGQPLIEHWNGTSWSQVASPTLNNGGSLNGVTAVSSNDVWAVGFNGDTSGALVEHWDGSSWSIVSSPAFAGVGLIKGVSADASNDVWAVSASTASILHWNGTSWSIVASPRLEAFGVTALSPTNVWAAGTVEDSDNDATIPAVEHWDGTNWSIVPSPNPNTQVDESSLLQGIAAISANDIWAVGTVGTARSPKPPATLTEHWDGTSWSIIRSPNPGDFANRLFGVTALSDGTVAAVGQQESSTTGTTPLILQNAASAPKTRSPTMAQTAPVTTTGTTAGVQTTTKPAPLDAVPVDQFFAAAAKADQPLSFAGHRSGAQHVGANGALDVLADDIGLLD